MRPRTEPQGYRTMNRKTHPRILIRPWAVLLLGLLGFACLGGACESAPLPAPLDFNSTSDDPINNLHPAADDDSGADPSGEPATPAETPYDEPDPADSPDDDQVLGSKPPLPITSVGSQPTDVLAIAIPPDRIEVTWKDNSDAETGFVIQRNVSRLGWVDYGFVGAGVTQFADTQIQPGLKHCYRVIATDGTNSSVASVQSCAVVPAALELETPDEESPDGAGNTSPDRPSAPSGLSVSLSGLQTVLHWTDTSTNEARFEIWRFDGEAGWVSLAVVEADSNSFIDTSAQPGASYCYRVRATNEVGAGPYSSLRCLSIPRTSETGATEPPDTTEPNEPTEPAEPTDPGEPSDPADPTPPQPEIPADAFYVAPDGSPNNDGSRDRPWPSVEFALTEVGGGRVIVLRPGVYAGPLRIRREHAGTPSQHTVILSEQKWAAIVTQSPSHGVFTDGGTDWILLDGLQVKESAMDGVKVNGAHAIVRNCWIHDNYTNGLAIFSTNHATVDSNLIENNGFIGTDRGHGHGIYATGSNITIVNNVFRYQKSHGIHLYSEGLGGVTDCFVANNLCYMNSSRGIIVDSPAGTPSLIPNRIVNNTSVHNGADGIAVVGGSSIAPHVVANNIIVGNRRAPLAVYPLGANNSASNADTPTVVIDYNLMDSDPRVAADQRFDRVTYGLHNLIGTASFTNESKRHYWLLSESMAIATGSPVHAPPADFWGRALTKTAPDLGALPYVDSLLGVPFDEPSDWWAIRPR